MLDPGVIGAFIPIMGIVAGIVAILVKHQQKMAELIHQNPQPLADVEMLRREVAEMKQLMHQQMIQVDTLIAQQSMLAPKASSQDISARLEG